MTTDTKQLTLAWCLKRKTEDTVGVDLEFERAIWWTGDDESSFQDAEPGTRGAATMTDRGEGTMYLHMSREDATRFEIGRQYAFSSTLKPLYEGTMSAS